MTDSAALPLISVITPCLNRAATIGLAVDSVLAQTDVTVEHIVVDGGSTDGTLDVLARYPHLTVLTGPDVGLYDAINRGIGVSRGAILAHLNSDDVFLPGALAAAAHAFDREPQADAACGGAVVWECDADGGAREIHAYDDPETKRLRPYDLCRGVPFINARFFRRGLYETVGGYDPSFRYAGDRDFLLRAWAAGMRTAVIPERVYAYTQHGDSLTISGGTRRVVPWLGEHLRLARCWSASAAAPVALRREARSWHAQEVGRAVALRFRDGAVVQALRLAVEGMAADPMWFGRFLGLLVARGCHRGR